MDILPSLTDSHFHLSELEKRGVSAVEVCESLDGFAAGMNISLDYQDLADKSDLLSNYPFIKVGYGIGPWGAQGEEAVPDMLSRLEREVGTYPVDAIGEAGLDYYWNYGTKERQTELFEGQIDLASRLSKPIIIHSRDADEDMKNVLKRKSFSSSGIIHCFSGDLDFARTALDAGLYISFAGPLTYKRNDVLREVAAYVPADRILSETDAPYLAPQKKRGKTNLPAYVSFVVEEMARVRNASPEVITSLIADNFNRLFR